MWTTEQRGATILYVACDELCYKLTQGSLGRGRWLRSFHWLPVLPTMHSLGAIRQVLLLAKESAGLWRSLKLTKKVAAYRETISDIGKPWQAYSDDLLQRLELFTCHLCIKWVTERCQPVPFSKRGNQISAQLPPCKDCLYQHARRANYQACIWYRSLECEPKVPSPVIMAGPLVTKEAEAGDCLDDWPTSTNSRPRANELLLRS